MRCKSGDVCLVLDDVPGCEANRGIYVTLTEPIFDYAWKFKNASRPVLSKVGGPLIRATVEGPVGSLFVLYDDDLLPVPNEVINALKYPVIVAP